MRFNDDIKLYFLKYVLVTDKPISNPNVRNGVKDSEGRVYKDNWRADLNVQILGTCRELYEPGMKLLYGQNTFRFSHELSFSPFFRPHVSSISQFFLDDQRTRSFKTMRLAPLRQQLIKNVLLEYSDNERNDEYAAAGYAKPMPDRMDVEDQFDWLKQTLAEMSMGLDWFEPGRLQSLIFTIDAQHPDLLKIFDKCFARRRKSDFLFIESIDKVKDSKNREFFKSLIDKESGDLHYREPILIKKVIVRGVNPPVEGDGGVITTTSRFPEYAKKLLSISEFRAEKIHFTGEFKARRIRQDGSLIPDSEWKPLTGR